MLFFKPVMLCWLLVIIGSVLATLMQRFFIKRKIPVFTLPFVLVTWGIVWLGTHYFPTLFVVAHMAEATTIDNLPFAVRGFGQVIFQGSVLSGFLFFVAVFLNSPMAVMYGVAVALFSSLFALFLGLPVASS